MFMMTEEWPAATTPTFLAPMKPRVVSTPVTWPLPARRDAGHLAILDDVDAAVGGAARIAPGDGVVARRAAAPLQRRADHGIAGVAGDVERRAEFLGLLRRQPFIVDAVQPVGMDVPLQHLDVVDVVREHHDAARANT